MDKKCFTMTVLLVSKVFISKPSWLVFLNLTERPQFIRVKKVTPQIIADFQYAKMRIIPESIQYRVYFDTALKQQYISKKNLSPVHPKRWTRVSTKRNIRDATTACYAKAVILRNASTSSSADCVITPPTRVAEFYGSAKFSAAGDMRVANLTPTRKVHIV